MSTAEVLAARRERSTTGVRYARDIITGIAVAAAVLAAVAFIVVVARRIAHPYELEWIEGGSLDQVRRVVHGQPLYTRPTVGWTPNIYAPLYYWVAAAVSRVTGLNFVSLRLVSVASSVAVGVFVWKLVRRETSEWVGPAIAVGLFFASYRIDGAWFDLARVDMLFVALVFGSLVVARDTTTPRQAIGAATLMVLAALTKQPAALAAIALVPWMVTRGRRCAVAYVGALVVEAVALFGLLQITTHGWFMYYAWTVPSKHSIEPGAILGFWTHDLARHLWPVLALAVLALVVMAKTGARSVLWFYVPVTAAFLIISYTARLHSGGWDNVLLPANLAVVVLGGIAVGRTRHAGPPAVATAAALLAVVQFLLLLSWPGTFVPAASSTAAGDEVVAQLRALPGPVLLTGQPWMLAKSGHGNDITAHASAIEDVLRARAGRPARELAAELEHAIQTHKYCAVVVDRPPVFSALPADFAQYYERQRTLNGSSAVVPVTGYPIGPADVWIPRGAPYADCPG